MMFTDTIPEHDVLLRVIVRRHVVGHVTHDKKAKLRKAVRRAIERFGGGKYCVELTEVASVTRTRGPRA